MKKLTSANVNDSIRSKLPRANVAGAQKPSAPMAAPPASIPASSEPESKPKTQTSRFFGNKPNAEPVKPTPPASTASLSEEKPREPRRFQFLPVFWTIASVMSFTVNIVILIVLVIAFLKLRQIPIVDQSLKQPSLVPGMATNISSGLLGGLYTNFVKMDQATITSTIPVDAVIPLNITVPVQATTRITLAESATIPNAHVRINTGALNINADAVVTLPANTPLMVSLDFPLNVQNSIPVHLDVPVNIPLNQTQLHEPFVGLQKVVEPWYCLIKPDVSVNGVQVCAQAVNPLAPGTVTP